MQELTVGNDPQLDANLVPFDCLGSAAHAHALFEGGYLTVDEKQELLQGLKEIYSSALEGKFQVKQEDEDCHTAIENYLTAKLGDPGRKIHTGRSRNDQILVTVRLYLRERCLDWLEKVAQFAGLLSSRYQELKDIPMPGYTHFQPAMPSSVGMWLHSFFEWSLALVREGISLADELNINPLGGAAGFGSSLNINPETTTKLLGFSRRHRSPIDANNSRGRYEEKLLRWSSDVAGMFEKLALEVVLFSMHELGFISLPNELTTGSSIMPQKRNPDLAELLRGRTAKVRAAATELSLVTMKLPQSYHRDLQYTKEPLLRGAYEFSQMIRMAGLIVERLQVNEQKLRQAMEPDLYATYDAYREVVKGIPFRDAYKAIAKKVQEGKIDKVELEKDFQLIAERTDRSMKEAESDLKVLVTGIQERLSNHQTVPSKVFAA